MTKRLNCCLMLGGLFLVTVIACSSTPSGPAGGFVSGPNNEHCVAAVFLDAGNTVTADDGQFIDDAGQFVQRVGICDNASDAGAPQYGDTNYGSQAADDDCKYNVSVTVSPIYQNSNVTFVVTATSRVDGGPVTGANTFAEVYLRWAISNACPAPNTAYGRQSRARPAPIPSGRCSSMLQATPMLATGRPASISSRLCRRCSPG